MRPLRGFVLLIPILTVIFAALVAAPALAVPQAITDARGDLEALRSQVQTLNDRVESSVEDYQYAKVQLADTEASLASTQKKLTRAEKDLVTAQSHMEQRIQGLYREGNLGLLDALLGARTFNDLINRFDLLKRVGAKDQEVYAQVASYRADVSARKATLAQNQAKQKKLLAESRAALASMKERLAERERALEGKEQQVAQLEAEEQARQARLAAQAKEAARQAAAAKARQQTTTKTRSNGSGNASADAPSRNVPSSPVSGSVIDIAMQYMGVPYVWGGASPSGFDCSGFVMYVFSHAGVSLPHSSRAQFGNGVAVSRDALQPGDLVFFGSPIHHVGIYVGGGNMIHAPNTGSSVRINSISRSNYAGARRIL